MDATTKNKISRQIARKFPEMSGVSPSVKRQSGHNGSARYLLIYKGKVELPGGKKMNRIVRVVADEQGKIVRISTSR